MQYSIYTRGIGLGDNDYKWSPFPHQTILSEYADFGFSVERSHDGMFSVYILSEESRVQDYMNRRIRIGILFTDCSQAHAKLLAVWALRHWGNYVGEFAELVDKFGSDNWVPNDDVIVRFFDAVTGPAAETPETDIINKRYQVDNTPQNRQHLAELLPNVNFSDGEGLKLVAINGSLPGSSERIVRAQVDRYLAGDAGKRELKNATSTVPSQATTMKKNFSVRTLALPGLLLLSLGYGVWFYNMDYLPLQSENERLLREYAPFINTKTNFEEQKRIWDADIAEKHTAMNVLETKYQELDDRKTALEKTFEQTKEKSEHDLKSQNDEIRKADERLHAIIQSIATLNTQVEKLNKEIDEKKKRLP